MRKKKIKVYIKRCYCFVQVNKNNVLLSVTDIYGNLFKHCSPRTIGFKGKAKMSPFSIDLAVKHFRNYM